MNLKAFPMSCLCAVVFLLTSCVAPISEQTIARIDRDITLAMVNNAPDSFIGKQLLLGAAVVSIEADKDTTVLEMLEWQLNSLGEPIYVDDAGLKFLVTTSQALDHIDEAGMLVTLVGAVSGEETRLKDGVEYTYPTLELIEIHLWDTPLRYGVHRNQDPGYPHYPGASDSETRNPYDPGYKDYPYSPYWLRSITH